MREWLRALSSRAELAIVLLAAFGLALVSTVRLLLTPEWWLHGAPPITNRQLVHTLIFEVVVGSMLWKVLLLRGWTRAKVGLSPVRTWSGELPSTLLQALGLVVAAYL